MTVCAAYRIPHGEFLGWSALDRGKAIWWQARQSAACPQCGTRPDEWEGEERLHAYTGTVAHCRGCEVKAQMQEQFERAGKGAYRRGSYVTLARNPEVH